VYQRYSFPCSDASYEPDGGCPEPCLFGGTVLEEDSSIDIHIFIYMY